MSQLATDDIQKVVIEKARQKGMTPNRQAVL